MARVGNSIIKDLDINQVIALLNKAYADEWLAYYRPRSEATTIPQRSEDSILLKQK